MAAKGCHSLGHDFKHFVIFELKVIKLDHIYIHAELTFLKLQYFILFVVII